MPCYRCGERQVDPVRGHSPWQRGVRGNQQVLVCPDCQGGTDWTADMDRCRQCGSVRLVRRLGEVECRECGVVVPPDDAGGAADDAPGRPVNGVHAARDGSAGEAAAPVSVAGPGLSEEVALALDRVLGRGGLADAAGHGGRAGGRSSPGASHS